jgi:hypothetical protein
LQTSTTIREKVTALPDRRPTAPTLAAPAPDPTEAVVTAILGMQQSLSVQISQDIEARVAAAVNAGVRAGQIGAFQAVASVLAVRFLLLLALLGGFALAFLALRAGTPQAAGVLVAYAVLVIIPLVWLYKPATTGG